MTRLSRNLCTQSTSWHVSTGRVPPYLSKCSQIKLHLIILNIYIYLKTVYILVSSAKGCLRFQLSLLPNTAYLTIAFNVLKLMLILEICSFFMQFYIIFLQLCFNLPLQYCMWGKCNHISYTCRNNFN